MKPFQPRTIEQQRKNYIKACKQRMSAEIRQIEEVFAPQCMKHAELYHRRCEIERRLGRAQDRVADKADREFGGWDVWRHDEKLLKIVVQRMDDAVVRHRQAIDAINERMEKVIGEMTAQRMMIEHRYHTLMRTA